MVSVANTTTEKFGNLLREHRKRIGLTQKQFGHRLGVSVSVISRWESNLKLPRPWSHYAAEFKDILELSQEELQPLDQAHLNLARELLTRVRFHHHADREPEWNQIAHTLREIFPQNAKAKSFRKEFKVLRMETGVAIAQTLIIVEQGTNHTYQILQSVQTVSGDVDGADALKHYLSSTILDDENGVVELCNGYQIMKQIDEMGTTHGR